MCLTQQKSSLKLLRLERCVTISCPQHSVLTDQFILPGLSFWATSPFNDGLPSLEAPHMSAAQHHLPRGSVVAWLRRLKAVGFFMAPQETHSVFHMEIQKKPSWYPWTHIHQSTSENQRFYFLIRWVDMKSTSRASCAFMSARHKQQCCGLLSSPCYLFILVYVVAFP